MISMFVSKLVGAKRLIIYSTAQHSTARYSTKLIHCFVALSGHQPTQNDKGRAPNAQLAHKQGLQEFLLLLGPRGGGAVGDFLLLPQPRRHEMVPKGSVVVEL
mmetsp:Transcript_13770/g.28566  ORF Transcript_13770/g.28566 Transcript_13770/m.28566 type:complete len:103 (-) Transcript_13770:943-1251(-)